MYINVYTTTTCSSIAANQRRDPRRELTVMFGHAASEMPHAAMHYKFSMQIDREKYLPVYSINIVCHRSSYFL